MELADRDLLVVECPLCGTAYSESRTALSTPCGHSFCSHCADELSADPDRLSFNCPLCGEPCIPDKNGLKRNVALHALLDEISGASRALRVEKSATTASSNTVSDVFSSDWKYLHIDFAELRPEALIDTGAFGEVHRCRWRGELVAAKLIRSGEIAPSLLGSFRREVEVMSVLHHPNVVLMLGACAEPPRLCLVMELMSGGSLYGLLHVNSVKLEPVETRSLSLDIAHGLQYLHNLNILHRDLKSKNVLLTRSLPRVGKLCDFGLSRVRAETSTMTGKIGTPQWTAPEVLIGSKYSFSADIYSFGMVLLEMVSGRLPYANLHPMAAIMAIAIKKQAPDIPDETDTRLKELISRCICWVAGDRLGMTNILARLESYTPLPPRQDSLLYKALVSLDRQDSGAPELEHTFASLVNGAVDAEPDKFQWTDSYWSAREKQHQEGATFACALQLQDITDEDVPKGKVQKKLDSLIACALEHGSSFGKHASWGWGSLSSEDGTCGSNEPGQTSLSGLAEDLVKSSQDKSSSSMVAFTTMHANDRPNGEKRFMMSEKEPTDQALAVPQLRQRAASPIHRYKSHCTLTRQQLAREIREFQQESLHHVHTVEYVNLPDKAEYLQEKLEEVICREAQVHGKTNPTLMALIEGYAAAIGRHGFPFDLDTNVSSWKGSRSTQLEVAFTMAWELISLLGESSLWIRFLIKNFKVRGDVATFDRSTLKKTTTRCLGDIRRQLLADIRRFKSLHLRRVKMAAVKDVAVIVNCNGD